MPTARPNTALRRARIAALCIPLSCEFGYKEYTRMTMEKVGLSLLAVLLAVIVIMLGPASLGAVFGAAIAIGVMRLTATRR